MFAKTDTRWFHYLFDSGFLTEIRFIKGRIKFLRADDKTSMSAPAPILVIVLTRERAAHIKTFAMEASL